MNTKQRVLALCGLGLAVFMLVAAPAAPAEAYARLTLKSAETMVRLAEKSLAQYRAGDTHVYTTLERMENTEDKIIADPALTGFERELAMIFRGNIIFEETFPFDDPDFESLLALNCNLAFYQATTVFGLTVPPCNPR